jgi:hypothetical protein
MSIPEVEPRSSVTEWPACEVPFEHPTRRELIRRLADAFKTTLFPPFIRACLYLADIDRLQSLIQLAEIDPDTLSAILRTRDSEVIEKCGFIFYDFEL